MRIKGAFLFRRDLTVLTCVVAAAFLSGCYQQLVSVGYLSPTQEWRSESIGQHTRIYGPDVEIIVTASNETGRKWITAPSEFAISLWFGPEHRRVFKFNPEKVMLVSPAWGAIAPRYVSVQGASPTVGVHTWSCWSNRRQPIEGKPPYALEMGDCFELYFKVAPPSPSETFTMRIDGLWREGRSVDIPAITFRKGRFWVSDFLSK